MSPYHLRLKSLIHTETTYTTSCCDIFANQFNVLFVNGPLKLLMIYQMIPTTHYIDCLSEMPLLQICFPGVEFIEVMSAICQIKNSRSKDAYGTDTRIIKPLTYNLLIYYVLNTPFILVY